jgi:glutaconate CoA-transferase, subunit A
VPLEPNFQRARQSGTIPEVCEWDEGMFQTGLRAAAQRLPFLPMRAGLGSDVLVNNPSIRTVTSPYNDEELVAVPALELDVALVHANRADERGNAQILGHDSYFDELFATAAKRCYLSCERVVPTDELAGTGCLHTLVLHRGLVHGVVETRYGAHPTWCPPNYGVDRKHLDEYVNAITPEAWSTYRERFVTPDAGAYVEAVGGPAYIEELPETVFF